MQNIYFFVQLLLFLVVIIALFKKSKPSPPPQINLDIKPIENAIKEIPTKVLHSITSSSNTHKGALGELIGYIQLRASYDRIVPLGNIVDFMCIAFPKQNADGTETPGHVDFIDIKTGDRSRLSKDQRELQKLIQEHRINFVKIKVDTSSANSSN